MCCVTRLILLFSIFLINVVANLRNDPLVDTKVGLIRGLRASDGDYSMFMGIPYARVRTDNPFANAIPQEPFDDIFEAYDDSAICPQREEFNNTITGSLDCLHLNIYVPDSASSEQRVPVLVWIYGGGYNIGFFGRYVYGPKYLVRHDIILVLLNYRLGPYGFMCLNTPEIPGNQGFKDQVLALRWIKDNIEAFGGDPNKVTISGNSAGAMSIDFHTLSPQERLFDSVILQSGVSLVPTYFEPVTRAPLILAQYFGHETENIDDAISFLASVDTNSVIAAVAALGLRFGPCIEPEFDNVDRFITENWITAAVPKIRNVPVLIGFNSQEAISGFGAENIEFPENMIINNLAVGFDTTNDSFRGMDDLIRQFYIGDKPMTENVRFEMVALVSDFTFIHPSIRTMNKYIDNEASDIFLYMFSYDGERNFAKILHNITIGEAGHADELGYLFDVSYMSQNPTASDQLVIDRMTAMWANFVKYSDPTPETSDLLTTKWRPITEWAHHYVEIGAELSSGSRPLSKRMTFWDLFYRTHYDLQWIHPGEKV